MASIETDDSQAKTFQIQSNDGEIFTIDQGVVDQSTVLADFVEMGVEPIPLPKVKGSILGPIVEYCNHHKNDPKPDPIDDDDDDDPNKDIYEPKRTDDITEWDQNFIKRFTVAEGTLFDIIMAANYLGIKSLLAVGTKTISNMTRGKSSQEVREMFNLSYDKPREESNVVEGQEESVSINGDLDPTESSPQPNQPSQ